MAKILVVDDEENIRTSLKSALENREHECVTAESFVRGQEFAQAEFDVIFLDVLLGDGSGVDLLREILARSPDQSVVMISGHADIDTAVQAIRLGAYDFIEKPISLDRILITIDNATKANHLLSEKNRLAGIVYGDFVGESAQIRSLRADIMRSAGRATRFLILGENGTGKELAAHMIHRHSQCADGPFIAVNCAALPSELVESELFGHTRGAFTGATRSRAGKFVEAAGGSIFLDEISEMSVEAQAKILRLIESKQVTPIGSNKMVSVNCNIIAASNRDLEKLVTEGRFRQDLFYRLNVVTLSLPALREHPEDLPLLASYFLQRFAAESGSQTKRLSDDAVVLLRQHEFPGNVRELKNLMERLNIYCDGAVIGKDDLKPFLPGMSRDQPTTLREAVERFERQYISAAISRYKGNMSEAARQLGLERSHLYKKMKKARLT